MKKTMKKLLATAFAGLLAFTTAVTTVSVPVKAAEESTESYKLFLAFGGDAAEENDWALNYAGGDASGDITATDAEIKVGETATVALEFANPVANAWYFAPTMIAENVVDADFTVEAFVDGEQVDLDMAAGDNWWYEATGDYSDTQAVRIAGGFNEWGTQYMAEPSGFKKIEFKITANSIKIGDGSEAVAAEESTEEYDMFLAFGGDAAEENDWALNYAGGDASGDITATTAKIKSGETATVALEFANPVFNAWYFAPTILAENVVEADFAVEAFIDGEAVELDMAAGDNWWYEATGDYSDTQAIRVAGGFNEWGTQYMAEPSGFKKIEFKVTANSIKVGAPAEEAAPTSSAGPVDKNGVYHAYLGIQGPKYSFRDAYDNAQTGFGTDLFNQITFQGDVAEGTSVPATINDVEIAGNGTYTVSITDIQWPEDEFADQDYMNLIFLSTDIPNTNEVTISDIDLKVGGSSVQINPIISPDSIDYLNMMIQNIWNEDVKSIGYYNTPFTDISITFTVSGFDYDFAGETEEANDKVAAEEAPAEEAPAETGSSNTPLVVGIIIAILAVLGIGGGIVVSKKKKN